MNLPPSLRVRGKTNMRAGDSIAERCVTQNPLLHRVVIETDMKTSNPLNGAQGNWHKRAAARKQVREQARAWIMYQGDVPALPVTVQLCRIGKGKLDDWDGLPASLKAVVDGIADAYGLRDDDPRITWLTPTQEKARTWGVRITIAQRKAIV